MLATISIILSILPGLAWLLFYLQEDPHPEPKRLIALTFITGAASAVCALYVQRTIRNEFVDLDIGLTSLIAIIAFAFIEEIAKFLGAYVAVHKSPEFDEPVDAMIYAIVAAIGFATIENMGAISGSFNYLHLGEEAFLNKAFEIASLRFVGATLLHTLATGILGYYWAISIRKFNAKRFLAFGIILATLLHAAFNYLIINYGELIYSLVFVVIVGFFALADFEKLKESPV